ncbi:MAG: hypothetical protein KJP17_06305 [Gammaproteobacteria bacterium]|nr:hypothetical protein [Gammaproteobacteria bacterium]
MLPSFGPVRITIALLTFLASAASWVYRFIDEHSPIRDFGFFILVPLIIWLLLLAPLFMTSSRRGWLRVLAYLLLVPTTLLWGVSILVGIYGLKIH